MCCHLQEFLLLLKTVTVRRFFNAVKLRLSWIVSRWYGKPVVWGMPEALSIEPTTACNLHCPECPVGNGTLKRPTKNLSFLNFEQIVDKTSRWCQYLSLYFQGEPFLNPQIISMIHYAKQKKMFVASSSNGHFFDNDTAKQIVESGLDKLIISLDGATPEIYQRYRVDGNFETVIDGIKNLVKWKQTLHSGTPVLVVQFVVFRHNEHQINEIKKLVASLGKIRLEIKSAQIYEFETKQNILPENHKYSRYDFGSNQPRIKSNLPNRCWRSWHSGVVTAQGDWVPCCFDKDADFAMGNLLSDNLDLIWKNTKYKDFREKIFTDRQSITMCKNCTEGLRKKL